MRASLFATIVMAPAAIAGPAAAADVLAKSKIETVTVFPQGAEVTRVAKVRIEKGDHTIVLNELPGQTIGASIRVEGKANARLVIGSVDNRRMHISSQDQASLQANRQRIENEIEKLRDTRVVLDNAIAAANAQKALLDNLARLPTVATPAGTAPAQQDWGAILALIGTRMGEVNKTVHDSRLKQRDIDKAIADLQKELAQLAPKELDRTEVKVHVTADAPLEATLTIRYQVPTASWNAFYDARLETGTKSANPKLQLTRRASIAQTSGEDWDDVALLLSTTRPGRGTAAPDVRTVAVDYEPLAPPAPRPMSRNMTTSPAPPATVSERRAPETEAQDEVKQKADERPAQISAAPFQAVFEVGGRVTVKGTGENKRVQIETSDIEPSLSIRSAPRIDPTAYLYAKLVLPKGAPLLSGPVTLIRDGVFVGHGRLPLLNPGEDHELGFGADDAVKIKYITIEEKKGETGLISTSKTDDRLYRVTVKNLHDRKLDVTLLDQLPISLNEEIKVELNSRSTAPTKKDVDDKRGVYAWTLPLNADEEKQIQFGYRIVWPAEKRVILIPK